MASNDILLSLQCNTLHLDRIKDTLELSRHRGMIKKKPLSAHSRECHVNIERQKSPKKPEPLFWDRLLILVFSHVWTYTHTHTCTPAKLPIKSQNNTCVLKYARPQSVKAWLEKKRVFRWLYSNNIFAFTSSINPVDPDRAIKRSLTRNLYVVKQ